MPTDYLILWDLDDDESGNVLHIGQHGLTKEDVEQALMQAHGFDVSRSSGAEIAFGPALDGRTIAVVYELIEADTIYPITAYHI